MSKTRRREHTPGNRRNVLEAEKLVSLTLRPVRCR
jgi:hypothetical protein